MPFFINVIGNTKLNIRLVHKAPLSYRSSRYPLSMSTKAFGLLAIFIKVEANTINGLTTLLEFPSLS